MLACEPNDRTFCDDGMIPNSLKLWCAVFGYFAANLVNFGAQKPACCARQGIGLECVRNGLLVHIMRTNIVIDDKLMADALRLTGLKTKREAVELGLRTLLRLRQQEEIKLLRGKLQWQGDLNAMRTDK